MGLYSNLVNMQDKTVLVTGGAGHIALPIVKAYAELGAELLLVDLDEKSLLSVKKQITDEFGSSVHVFCCDLECDSSRTELVNYVEETFTKLDVFVNTAAFVGTSNLEGWATPFEQQTVDTWRRALEVNLTSMFHLTQALMPRLKQSNAASIINIASTYATWGPDWGLYEGTEMANPAAYAASKGGLLQFTRWLATTIAPDVRVNAISPGGVFRGQPEVFVERYEKRTPMRRMAKEEDFVGAAVYLATELSSYVTGQNIAVDGGWGVW